MDVEYPTALRSFEYEIKASKIYNSFSENSRLFRYFFPFSDTFARSLPKGATNFSTRSKFSGSRCANVRRKPGFAKYFNSPSDNFPHTNGSNSFPLNGHTRDSTRSPISRRFLYFPINARTGHTCSIPYQPRNCSTENPVGLRSSLFRGTPFGIPCISLSFTPFVSISPFTLSLSLSLPRVSYYVHFQPFHAVDIFSFLNSLRRDENDRISSKSFAHFKRKTVRSKIRKRHDHTRRVNKRLKEKKRTRENVLTREKNACPHPDACLITTSPRVCQRRNESRILPLD